MAYYGQAPGYGGYGQEVRECEYDNRTRESYMNNDGCMEVPRGHHQHHGYADNNMMAYQPGHHNNYQRNERLGEAGAAAAGAFAMYEGYKAKNDPAHAHKHKQEAGIGGLGALASAGYAMYEHKQKENHRGDYY